MQSAGAETPRGRNVYGEIQQGGELIRSVLRSFSDTVKPHVSSGEYFPGMGIGLPTGFFQETTITITLGRLCFQRQQLNI